VDTDDWLIDTQASYDTVAVSYADQMASWLREAGFMIEAHLLLDPDAARRGALLFARRQA
jgi:hypothetical protein